MYCKDEGHTGSSEEGIVSVIKKELEFFHQMKELRIQLIFHNYTQLEACK